MTGEFRNKLLSEVLRRKIGNYLKFKGSIVSRIAIFLFSFLILTRFTFDPDLGWHLAIGKKFLESGEIIRGDPFSWTMPGYVFGNYFFGYQILVAFLFKNLGYVLTTMVFGLIASLAVILLLPKALDFIKIAAVFLGLGVAVTNLGLRPHVISFLLFAILLRLLAKKFFLRKTHALFWFIFFVVWANFHQGFLVGVLTFSAFTFCDLLIEISNKKREKQNVFLMERVLCVAAAGLAGLLTPFHGQLWGSVVNDLFGGKTWSSIAEYQPIVVYLPWSLLYGVSGLVFAYILFKKFSEANPAWFLLAAFIFMLPFLAVNFVFFWAAFFIYIASRYLEVEVDLRGYLVKAPIIFASLAAGIALVLGFFLGILDSVDLQNRLRRDGYPIEAVSLLAEEGFGRVFNNYAWGGYIDLFNPETRVFIDGRMTGWRKKNGDYILADYLEILNGNCELASQYDIKTVLMEKDYENKCFSNFREVYRDSVAKILVKG